LQNRLISSSESSHTIVDAHIYCGNEERGKWYGKNLEKLQEKISKVEDKEEFLEVKKWVQENAPEQSEDKKIIFQDF